MVLSHVSKEHLTIVNIPNFRGYHVSPRIRSPYAYDCQENKGNKSRNLYLLDALMKLYTLMYLFIYLLHNIHKCTKIYNLSQ